jgi:hypothetical protein
MGVGIGAGWLRLRVASQNLSRYPGVKIPTLAMNRHPISVRPTAAQLAWLKAERERRGIALNALVLMALEAAMASANQAADPEKG